LHLCHLLVEVRGVGLRATYCVAADVDVNVQLVALEDLLQLLNVVVDSRHDGNDQNLAGADPEGPLAAEMFNENAKEPLE